MAIISYLFGDKIVNIDLDLLTPYEREIELTLEMNKLGVMFGNNLIFPVEDRVKYAKYLLDAYISAKNLQLTKTPSTDEDFFQGTTIKRSVAVLLASIGVVESSYEQFVTNVVEELENMFAEINSGEHGQRNTYSLTITLEF